MSVSTESKRPSRRAQYGQTLEIAAGLWLWAAFIGMFFTDSHPALKPYVMWTLRIYLSLFLAFIAGIVLYSIAMGAKAAYSIWTEVVRHGEFGIVGRTLWAIYFLIAFVIAVALTRF